MCCNPGICGRNKRISVRRHGFFIGQEKVKGSAKALSGYILADSGYMLRE